MTPLIYIMVTFTLSDQLGRRFLPQVLTTSFNLNTNIAHQKNSILFARPPGTVCHATCAMSGGREDEAAYIGVYFTSRFPRTRMMLPDYISSDIDLNPPTLNLTDGLVVLDVEWPLSPLGEVSYLVP